MSRTPLPYAAADVAALARSLERQIAAHDDGRPGHVEMLNMLARAGGFSNFQHFRTQAEAVAAIDTPVAPTPVDTVRLARIAGYFDAAGRLIRWPGKANHRGDCLWVMWSRLPARLVLHEREINARLGDEHLFGDHALIRRELVDRGMMARNLEGTEYRRVEGAPPPEAKALIRLLAPRLRTRP